MRGFSLWVTDVKVDSNLVAMKVRFKNSSSATHVDPADLRLVDSQNQVVAPVHDAPGCAAWGRYEFVRTKTFGPVAECFRPSTTSAPLKLRWSPDFGFLCCDLDIVLTTLGT